MYCYKDMCFFSLFIAIALSLRDNSLILFITLGYYMKKNILLLLSALLLLGCREEAFTEPTGESADEILVSHFSEDEVIKGRMRIKLKEEPTSEVTVRSSGNTVTTGIRALDRYATAFRITHMERTFPPCGRYEERSRREGLHLWYDVWFAEEVAATRAVGEVSLLEGIEVAAPVLKVISAASFNDPYLPRQWNYYNPGNESWQQAGADIRLSDVWQQYNGHPDIIVSIVDGGIALTNPDLQANLWINKGEIADNGLDDDGNGYVDDVYGYNFVSNRATITPHRHGTHVAGIIGAANNNGVGVCGIAGGDGAANSGAKLMSCQIFEHPSGDYRYDNIAKDIPAAIKYGADNGSVISQNSWGHAAGTRASSYIDPAEKAAIDYFVKYAGCDNDGNQLPDSPMEGGIVLFASGNANSSNPRVAAPADYEKVLGVAAIGPDYRKALYSNYGDYMDISAPGGSKENGIYSTTLSQLGDYEYLYGTSMACPHVAGVAALVIEKYGVGKQGFTADQLEEILLTTAYDLDSDNPQYAGLLGYGSVDAFAALGGTMPPSTQSFALRSNPVSDGMLSFQVNADLAGDARISIYNGTGSLVYRKQVKTKKYVVTTLDIIRLAAGYYTLDYECNGNKVKEKFIKY